MADMPDSKNSHVSTISQETPRGILHGPITPTLFRLALPTVVVLVVQTFVGVAETYFVSFLGTEALAGVTLVFPVLMLMQMMSNGGIGGGVSSAVARALGANRHADADGLVWHSIVLATVFGAIFSVAAIFLGPVLYRSMGGTGETLRAALLYSGIVFAGSIPIWITALLSAALRGRWQRERACPRHHLGAFLLLVLSPPLIFGWGSFPQLGVAGGGAAVFFYYFIAALVLALYLRSSSSPLKFKIVPLQGRLFKDILGVGLPSAVGTIQVSLTVTFVTAAVGHFGADAIAGFGIASRLDYLQIPIIFGLGTAIVTMVGINIGAAQIERARRVAWVGAGIAFGLTQTIGILATLFPMTWMRLFTADPDVQQLGSQYLQIVAPAYGAVGLGLALYFASQGLKRVLLPVLAGTVRMILAAFVGWASVILFQASLNSLFQIVAAAAIAYGGLTALAVLPRRMFHLGR